MNQLLRVIVMIMVCALARPGLAQTPFLALPVDCTIGDTCFIEDFVDTDPAANSYRDHTCGLNSRDGHKGTDIALIDWSAIETGVNVLAAADGTVTATRDSMVDDRRMPGVTSKNACGNAVMISHPNGYRTLYCHLKSGSVRVSKGDRVSQGQPLGMVGLSGRTTHPHLHMTLYKGRDVVDPFRPTEASTCGEPETHTTLWQSAIPYEKSLLRNAGFALRVPTYDDLKNGTARVETISSRAPMIVYAEAGFAQHGDILTISAFGPDGTVFTNSRIMKHPKVSQLPAFGKRAPESGWPTGEYTGQLTLTRQGKLIANRWAHVTVTP